MGVSVGCGSIRNAGLLEKRRRWDYNAFADMIGMVKLSCRTREIVVGLRWWRWQLGAMKRGARVSSAGFSLPELRIETAKLQSAEGDNGEEEE
ncbi:unnamed protein product [Linum trigynum]|uniref:Uncharacterized protein n=1 Tax=Linum trigynum TaxID=586398 RepID=A0AAV2FY71_9ROSI